jgi:hypothetical protein
MPSQVFHVGMDVYIICLPLAGCRVEAALEPREELQSGWYVCDGPFVCEWFPNEVSKHILPFGLT